jgi:ketopantoate reductase
MAVGRICLTERAVSVINGGVRRDERRIALADMAFFPTKTLSELSVDDTVTQLRHIGGRWASLMPHNKISALQDVERGKRLEVEETLGYAVQQGAALVIPTPALAVCYKLIAGINHYLQ